MIGAEGAASTSTTEVWRCMSPRLKHCEDAAPHRAKHVRPAVGLPLLSATSPATTPQASARRLDIEGLRAVAILLVLVYHAGVPWLTGGFIGVDVFFVISGFLITGLLVREIESTGRVSLARFYARRTKRLLPATVLVIITTAALTWATVSQ